MAERTLGRAAVESLAGMSRRALENGWLGWRTAAVLKRALPRVLQAGTFAYRDRWGHEVEADVADAIERAGFVGAHSPALMRCLDRLLEPGDWAIDVGANVGLLTGNMCGLVGRGGTVWAFEPLPANVGKLERLKAANGLDQLTIFPVALAARNSTARLRLPVGGGNSCGTLVAAWEAGGEIDVPTRRLDDLVAEHRPGADVKLLKIDAEGAEPEVVAGAASVLSEMRPLVVCELNDVLLRCVGSSSEALLGQFAALGYRTVRPVGRHPRSRVGHCVDVLLEPR